MTEAAEAIAYGCRGGRYSSSGKGDVVPAAAQTSSFLSTQQQMR